MKQKWLITGGCGFVGSNLAANLLADGHDVVAFDNLSRLGSAINLQWLQEQARRPQAGQFLHVMGDTRSQTDVDVLFQKHGESLSAVAHLAGQVAMTTSLERPRYDFEVNVLGAINVLEGLRRFAPKAVALFSSTNKVYGDLTELRHEKTESRWVLTDYPNGLDENLPLNFQSPYGCSKGAADQYFLDYHRMFGLKTIVFRHSSMYGGRQFATYDQGWVGWFCQEVLRQKKEAASGQPVKPFTISGDGRQVRDLLHADDLVQCYRQAFTNSEKCAGQAFNIGGGAENSLSLRELFVELEKLTQQKPQFTEIPWRVSDQKVFVANNSKATSRFGWTPKVPAIHGIQRMMDWSHTQLERISDSR